jgi:hypothetical protein
MPATVLVGDLIRVQELDQRRREVGGVGAMSQTLPSGGLAGRER